MVPQTLSLPTDPELRTLALGYNSVKCELSKGEIQSCVTAHEKDIFAFYSAKKIDRAVVQLRVQLIQLIAWLSDRSRVFNSDVLSRLPELNGFNLRQIGAHMRAIRTDLHELFGNLSIDSVSDVKQPKNPNPMFVMRMNGEVKAVDLKPDITTINDRKRDGVIVVKPREVVKGEDLEGSYLGRWNPRIYTRPKDSLWKPHGSPRRVVQYPEPSIKKFQPKVVRRSALVQRALYDLRCSKKPVKLIITDEAEIQEVYVSNPSSVRVAYTEKSLSVGWLDVEISGKILGMKVIELTEEELTVFDPPVPVEAQEPSLEETAIAL